MKGICDNCKFVKYDSYGIYCDKDCSNFALMKSTGECKHYEKAFQSNTFDKSRILASSTKDYQEAEKYIGEQVFPLASAQNFKLGWNDKSKPVWTLVGISEDRHKCKEYKIGLFDRCEYWPAIYIPNETTKPYTTEYVFNPARMFKKQDYKEALKCGCIGKRVQGGESESLLKDAVEMGHRMICTLKDVDEHGYLCVDENGGNHLYDCIYIVNDLTNPISPEIDSDADKSEMKIDLLDLGNQWEKNKEKHVEKTDLEIFKYLQSVMNPIDYAGYLRGKMFEAIWARNNDKDYLNFLKDEIEGLFSK